MKLKNSYFYTLRDDIKEEESISGNLLVRSGMIRKNSAGIYMFLPLGFKVLKNIENIIREEMNATGAMEVLMPSLVYEDYYIKSGRKEKFGPSVFTLNDRFDKPYVLGPTHEELFAIASSYAIKSYKDLPFNLYQFQNKFRDEARPRFGLIRVREFIMKDAYSFDKDFEGLDISYEKMYEAYKKSFDRMNINYRIFKADTGVMGGLLSEEFQALTDIGEDTLVVCESCDYASNLEIAQIRSVDPISDEKRLTMEKIHTPNTKTIEDLARIYDIDPKAMVKVLFLTDNNGVLTMVLLRGDRTLNELKLTKYLDVLEVRMSEDDEIRKIGCVPGFASSIGINKCKIIADNEIKNMVNFVTGANEEDYHYKNVNLDDIKIDDYVDLRLVEHSDVCPECGGKITFSKGIEIGNTFKLGTKYAQSYDIKYSDQNNELKPVVMGSYGIGTGRVMAAIVEQSNDEHGIIWPMSIAPYKVAIILIDNNDDIQSKLANDLYDKLNNLKIDVLLDDRDERPGVKFKDMDLIGIPLKIIVGKKAEDNIVEFKTRRENIINEFNSGEVIDHIKSYLE